MALVGADCAIIVSAWPQMYFVAAWIDRSTPRASAGKKIGVPQVLSISTEALRACATAAIAGTSCTSKVSEPGLSQYTALVLGRNNAAMPSRSADRNSGFDAIALQDTVAKEARRPVATVDHQQMIACAADRQDRRGDGIQAGGQADGAGGAFQRADRLLEAARRRRAAPAIGIKRVPDFSDATLGCRIVEVR